MPRKTTQYQQNDDDLRQRSFEQQPAPQDDDNLLGVFPLILVFLLLGRIAIYVFFEHMGTTTAIVGMALNVLFGGVGITVLYRWIEVGWKVIQWLIIPKCVVVFVALMLCAAMMLGQELLPAAVRLTEHTHPFRASALILIALLLAASPGCERSIFATLKFLKHPVKSLKDAFGI